MRDGLLAAGLAALLCAAPSGAALFDAEEYERPAPPDMAARTQALAAAPAAGWIAIPDFNSLDQVNRLINGRTYVEDAANYGVADHWATPPEFERRGGDCEDFAIAKYAMLKSIGVPAESMRVVVVRDLALGTQHAVLSVEAGGERYILDNQASEVLLETEVTRYRPIYALSETRWWMFIPRSG